MTEIAFHFNVPDKLQYACRVARKLVHQGKRLVVQAPADVLDPLDQMLWNMAPHDFVAHCRDDASASVLEASPIVLTQGAGPVPHTQVLLNLLDDVPASFSSFEKLIEVVSADDAADRAAARVRWKHYLQRGYELVRHS